MQLLDLAPHWICTAQGRHGMGISLLCPACCKQRLAIWFKNPLDGGPAHDIEFLWERVGDTFETLSLSPSVDGSVPSKCPCTRLGPDFAGDEFDVSHWHGYIRDGQVTNT